MKEIITIREIDCTGKKIHLVGLFYLSDNGKVIKRESYEPKEWDSIIPDSVDDALYHAIPKGLGFTTILHYLVFKRRKNYSKLRGFLSDLRISITH